MNVKIPENQFMDKVRTLLNSGQSRSIALTGNVYDLFHLDEDGNGENVNDYIPLPDYLVKKWSIPNVEDQGKRKKGKIVLTYELNGPVYVSENNCALLRKAWSAFRGNVDENKDDINRMVYPSRYRGGERKIAYDFDKYLKSVIGNPTFALEFLRQLCLCSRQGHLFEDLIIIIIAADMLFPPGDVRGLHDTDRARVHLMQSFVSDPEFMNSNDCLILISESQSQINERIVNLPQVLLIDIPSPNIEDRKHFIYWLNQKQPQTKKLKIGITQTDLASRSAALSIQALQQLLRGSIYGNKNIEAGDVIEKQKEYVVSQFGEDGVEFKVVSHTMRDLVGFKKLINFLENEFIPRVKSRGEDALSGAAVAGPVGSGKTFIFEAVAGELGIPVLVIKNIRSKWFGGTDVLIERLHRIIVALDKVMIIVDEADTQFGGLGQDSHETEKRLTGKIQSMMSDRKLRGKVVWLLITARIHRLSPDLRRPGRAGSLIIPVLDPEGEDKIEFIKWMVEPVIENKFTNDQIDVYFSEYIGHFYPALFSEIRSELISKKKLKKGKLDIGEVVEVLEDVFPPSIEDTRRYQTLQALVNCTRKSLMPLEFQTIDSRKSFQQEILKLEGKGIS